MKYLFHEDALEEFAHATKYYQEQVEGLGIEFSSEIFKSIEVLIRFVIIPSPIVI